MKKFFCILFTIIVTLIILTIILFVYLWVKNPLNLREIIKSAILHQETQTVDQNYDHPLLDQDKGNKLRDLGVDPATLPTEITPQQIECAKEKLGEERINQLLKDQNPTPLDIIKLTPCF